MKTLPPIPGGFTTRIASREFELVHRGGIERVTVEVGMPVNDVETMDGFDWRCPVRIIAGGEIIEDRACGCDAFQALGLAMNPLVRMRLERIARDKGAEIRLFGEAYNFEF